MRISEFYNLYKTEYPTTKDSRTHTKGIRSAWKRSHRGRNKGKKLLLDVFEEK